MEARRRLYKAGPRDNPTLSERVRHNRNRNQNARLDKFAASRKIPIEESPQSPKATKVSEIADRKQKLKAYRLQKNTEKFKQIQEQRSPFIVAVPVGRWVEKKEKGREIDFNMNATPVRKALINERVLKKSTIKNLMAQSTAKKENAFTFSAKAAKPEAKSKKKILGELNAVPHVENAESDLMPMESFDLNSTFEISPASPEKEEEQVKPSRQLRRSTSLPEIAKKIKHDVKKKPGTPPAKPVAAKKAQVNKPKPVMKAQIKKPVVVKRPAAKTDSNFRITKPVVHEKLVPAAHKKHVPAAIKKTVVKATEKYVAIAPEAPVIIPRAERLNERPAVEPKKPAKPQDSARLFTYNVYKSSMDTQVSYLTMHIQDISSNNEAFLATLSEDQQMSVHEILNQGKLFISEDLKKFGEVLEAFKLAEESTRITDDDIENQWYRVYDGIEKLKVSLSEVQLMKKHALASLQKRRTRRTYNPDEGTPKRSKRIADNAETPKHNVSCYGCVTMSASRVNTPRSTSKRRTTGKKSVVFENVETPKRGSGRRSTRVHKPTPKRNLMRMNAIDGPDESELNIEELS